MSGIVFLSRRDLLASGVVSVLGGRALFAQEKPATFSGGVQVVNVLATVRDKDGKLVTGLSKEDFELQEDGKPQKISYFARQADTPLTLGLLIDTSRSVARMIGTERDASTTFIDDVLRPASDKAFVLHFDSEVELLQDLTASREKLDKAIDQIAAPQLRRANGPDSPDSDPPDSGSSGGGYGHGRSGHMGTMLYDSLYLASDELMSKQTGRKAVLLLTDGEDRNSKTTLGESISSSLRANTLVYAIRVEGEEMQQHHSYGGPGMGGGHHGGGGGGYPGGGGGYPGGGGGYPGGGGGGGYPGGRGGGRGSSEPHVDGKKILQQIARETGGGYFEVSKKKTLDEIFKQMSEELRNQYSIGYTPDASVAAGYHKIQVATSKKGLVVQARDGYYTKA